MNTPLAGWLLAFLAALQVSAAPFVNLRLTFTQPDGTPVEVIGSGDEFYAVFETLEGYTTVFDQSQQAYCFAREETDGRLVSTGVQIHRGNPAALNVKPHARMSGEWRRSQARERRERWEEGMQVERRWSERKTTRRAQAMAGSSAGDEPGPVEPSPPSSTTLGVKVGLCLLIDFDDAPGTIPQGEIINFCNADNYTGYGNYSSVKKYFQNISNGLLTYTNVVTVYIRIPNSLNPRSYYNDTSKDCGAQGNLLIRDALNILKALPNYTTEILPTFKNLTVDSLNRVVACNVFFAGGNSGVWNKGLWPHSWSLYNVGAQWLSTGGKRVYRYQITNIGSSLSIGTFCHENGHLLCGFPDLYDYDYDSRGGAGNFCLMGYGNGGNGGRCPAQVSAYLKRAAGWAATINLSSNSAMSAMVSVAPGSNFNTFYRLQKPGVATEYFLIEGRYKTGHDTYLPGSGVAIWHVDELGSRDNQSLTPNTTHANFELSLVQADNRWDLHKNVNAGDANDLYYGGNPSTGYLNQFSDNSSPNARWWDGSPSGAMFTSFSPPAATMTFNIGNGPIILAQPQSRTVTMGTDVTFTVGASGQGITYQWRFYGTNLAGATKSSLTRTNVQPADAGPYAAVLSNAGGSILSATAALTVNALPIITAQPADAYTGLGLSATFNVTAASTAPMTYQWQFEGASLADATTSSYTVAEVRLEDQGAYTVLLTNAYGWTRSAPAWLRVLDPFITGQPQTQVGEVGGAARFDVASIGAAPMSYQWRFNGAALAGATEASLLLTNLQLDDIGFYSVTVSNPSGERESQPAALVLEGAPPRLALAPLDQTVPAGSTAAFTVQALGVEPLSFQWFQGGTPLANAGKISGAQSPSLVLSNVQTGEMGQYSILVSNAYGSVASSNASLIIWPVLGWGQNTYAQADIPAAVTNAAAVAAGYYHSLALNKDGSVSGWGAGMVDSGVSPHYGQAQVPSTLAEPPSMEMGATVAVAAGAYHSLALRADGRVVAWGAGSANTGSSPHYGQAMVPAGLSNVTAISAGGYSSLALKRDGTVAAWGAGTINTGVSPNFGQAAPPAGLANVAAIAAGSYHALALQADGRVIAWGANPYGQSDVPAGLSNVVAIAAGADHCLALTAGGTVVAWGRNNYGQIDVPPGLDQVVAINGGINHSLALRSDGTVVGWGAGAWGQAVTPAGVANVAAIAAGGSHNLVVETGGNPTVVVEPVSRYGARGDGFQLTSLAVGSPPLGFQWFHNGTPVWGADSSSMELSDLQPALAGDYFLVVSNHLGAATSAVAMVNLSEGMLRTPRWTEGGFLLEVSGIPGWDYVVQNSTNLIDWTSLATNKAPFTFLDSSADAGSPRFYRLWRDPRQGWQDDI